jgi:hypothetical protein
MQLCSQSPAPCRNSARSSLASWSVEGLHPFTRRSHGTCQCFRRCNNLARYFCAPISKVLCYFKVDRDKLDSAMSFANSAMKPAFPVNIIRRASRCFSLARSSRKKAPTASFASPAQALPLKLPTIITFKRRYYYSVASTVLF